MNKYLFVIRILLVALLVNSSGCLSKKNSPSGLCIEEGNINKIFQFIDLPKEILIKKTIWHYHKIGNDKFGPSETYLNAFFYLKDVETFILKEKGFVSDKIKIDCSEVKRNEFINDTIAKYFQSGSDIYKYEINRKWLKEFNNGTLYLCNDVFLITASTF